MIDLGLGPSQTHQNSKNNEEEKANATARKVIDKNLSSAEK